jgi:hypothetical protein
VYTHPELGLRLAQGKIEEARAWARQVTAFRAASPEQRVPQVIVRIRRKRRAARMLPVFGRSRARRRSLRASAPRTTKG